MRPRFRRFPSKHPHFGTLSEARSFALAASYIDEASKAKKHRIVIGDHVDINVYGPFCYLCGHAIELALKSILIFNGYDEKKLKGELGHDLEKTWDHAIKCSIPCKENLLNEELKSLVIELNPDYMTKELEYFTCQRGMSLPHSDRLLDALNKLISGLDFWYRESLQRPRSHGC